MKSTGLMLFFAVFLTVSWGQSLSPVSLEQLVNTDVSTTQFNSQIATDPTGAYVIIWTTQEYSGAVMARRYNSSHVAISGELTINSQNSSAINIEHWEDGKYVISYIETTGNNLKFTVLDELNAVGAEVTVLASAFDYDLAPKGDSLALLYRSTSNGQLYLRGYNLSTNAWFNAGTLVTEIGSSAYFEPNIIYHNDGRLTAIYNLYINVSGNYERRILRKTFSSSFVAEIPEYTLWSAQASDYIGDDLDASGNDNDEIMITTAHFTGSTYRQMRLWILSNTGSFIVNNTILLDGTNYFWYDRLECQLYNNGNFLISKSMSVSGSANPNEGEAYIIYGVNYNTSNSGVLQMNSTNSGSQEYATCAKLPNGGFVACWAGNGFQGDTQGIYSRAYNAVSFPSVTFSNAGTYTISETGTTATIGVTLATQPTANVTVNLTSSDLTEGTVSVSQLTFTPANWNVVQNVMVTGVDDVTDDGDIPFNLVASTTGSADVAYAALPNKNQAITNLDNDATISMPSTQSICQSTGMSSVNAIITNVGSAISSVVGTSNNQSIIDNSDITVNNLGGGTYGIVIANLSNNSLGTAQITLTANDGQFNYTGNFNVTTTGITLVTNATSNSICQGQSVTLSATGGQNISWNNGVVNNTPFTPSGTMTYTVTGDNGAGCTGTATETIVVTTAPSNPTVSANGPVAICGSGSVTLTSSYASGNTWSNGSTASSITVSTAGTYSVTYSNGGACSVTSTPVVVTVTPVPSTPIVTPSGATNFCAGGSVTLTSSEASGNTWSNGSTASSITVSTSGTYSVTYANGGCSATSTPITLTVNPIPSTPVITPSGATSFCSGGSVTLTSSQGSGNTWSNGSTASNITVSTAGTYSVTYTNGGCSATSTPITITVNSNPPAPIITPNGPTTFCSGGSVTLTSSQASGNSWSTSAVSQSINVTSTNTYMLTYTDGSGCTSPATSVLVTVQSAPSVSAGQDQIVCNGASITLNGSGAATYDWDNGVTNGVSFVPTLGTTTYTVTGTSAGGCEAEDQITVTVNQLPNVSISTIPIFCLSDGSAALTQGSPSGGTYAGTGITGVIFSPSTAGLGIYPVTYTYTDLNGCQNTASSTITVDQCLSVDELLAGQLTVYPNPTVGLTTIELPGSFNYSVADAQGRIVTKGAAWDSTQLDLTAFSDGVYQLIIQAENASTTVRIVKN
ncbi:T9SS type A sorting domain-containing protein [Fluviicola taffensis]|uniref:beta strand repeat-containing protein n=1 Tax=Fluviicola taffensis TaxID=191579 RepID=UPI003137C856